MPMSGTIGLLVFELFMWTILLSLLVYVILKLYNGILASLPFAS